MLKEISQSSLTETPFYDLRKDKVYGNFMDTLYNVYAPPPPPTSCSAALGAFTPLMNWRWREYGNSPLCSAGHNERSCTLIFPFAFVVLVSLSTVLFLYLVPVVGRVAQLV